MRSKHIAALITFFATFAFSAFIALLFATPKIPYVPPVDSYEFKTYDRGCKKNTGYKIKEFLVKDKRNGSNRTDYGLSYKDGIVSRESLSMFAESVSEYVGESSSMDDSRFPRDFRSAWREHMRAWSDYEEFLHASKTKNLTFADFNSRADLYTDEISRTWHEVLQIGREYGADIPRGF